MATIDAERLEQEMRRAQKHGSLIKEKRLDLGLKRPAFVAEVARQGQDMTPDYLNKIESGVRPLANVDPKLREAIRAVLGYSADEWHSLTGLYAPDAISQDHISSPPRFPGGSPIPPVVPHRALPLNIPPELQTVIDEYGDLHPQLRQENVIRLMLSPRDLLGPENGPQTEKDWLQHFYYIRDVVMRS